MPSIHLLNKPDDSLPQPVETSPGMWESGFWRVSIERAEMLKEYPIHFHRRKADASFLSGIVTDYRREPYTTAGNNTSDRTIFIFTALPDSEVMADPDGWTPAGVKFIP